MSKKDSSSPATKADIAALHRSIDGRFDQIDERLNEVDRRFDQVDERFSTYDRQFEVILQLLSPMDDALQAVRRDLRVVADKLLNDHERRLLSCERRLGMAV